MKTLLKIIFLFSLALSLSSQATSDQDQQIKILKDFYKQYFNREISFNYGQWPEVFSTKLKNALNQNIRDCEKFVREHSICGYSADFDPYTFSQDASDTLNFENSLFTATVVAGNTVKVSFTLFPEQDVKPTTHIEYQFIKEADHWKIDDMEGSIYKRIEEEHKALAEESQKLRVALWPFENSIRENQIEFFKMFINTKTQICQNTQCRNIQSEDIEPLVSQLNKHYFSANDKSYGVIYNLAPDIQSANEGDKAEAGLFSFVFMDQLWMIERINLNQL